MFSRNRDTDMGSGPLFGKILLFALPIMALNLLQLLFNAADMIVVGQFAGKQPLAAVGATGALINLLVNIFMGLSVGTSVVVAQNFGAQDYKGIHDSVHTSIAISIIGGFFVMVIGLLFCEPLLEYMGTPDDIIHLSTLYMKIYFLGR
jgi:Na+-driven multidrug efflux pump